MSYPDSFVHWFLEELEKAAGVPSVKEGRSGTLPEIVAELKRKADRYDALVAEARAEPLRKNQ